MTPQTVRFGRLGQCQWRIANTALVLVFVGCGAGATDNVAPASAPPAPNDWSSIYRGSGSLTLHVQNGSAHPIFVKVRHRSVGATAAQVDVAPNATQTVHVEGGSYQILLKTVAEGRARFFKGNDLDVPPNARGEATLIVGVGPSGLGEGLHEIGAEEFGR